MVGDPHNQTLNVAVQWGIVGVVLLWALWLTHLALFRGETMAAWVGLTVVVQNMLTSLLNSHLLHFHEGWMYMLGVGVAGGMVLCARGEPALRLRFERTAPCQPRLRVEIATVTESGGDG